MRRITERVKQLNRLYSTKDGRLQGNDGWKKLPFFWFLLFLSYKCTKKCKYCYSFDQISDNTRMEMDDNTFARLLDWIPEVWELNNVKVNSVGFLGGEPLLRTDRIKQVMDSVYRNTDGMQGYLYTNGDLVDFVNWDDLEDIQWISTNVTDTSLEELSRRMTLIGLRSNVINQTVVATLDDFNLERVLDLTRFGIENGYRLRYSRDLFRSADGEYRGRLLRKYHQVCDLLENYVISGYDVNTTFLIDMLIPGWNLEVSPYPCGKRIANVYPDGSVGPCIRNHLSTGTIFDPDPLETIQSHQFHYDVRKPYVPSECMGCECKSTCQGGCPNDKLLHTGTASGKSVMCEVHKEIIPRLRYLDALKEKSAPKAYKIMKAD
jgi:uncharacterized protein